MPASFTRRSLLSALGAAVVSTAGCLSSLQRSATERTVLSIDSSRGLSREQCSRFVAAQVETFDTHGVWGQSTATTAWPFPGRFRAAWKRSWTLTSTETNGGLRIPGTAAAVVGTTPAAPNRQLLWLWAGATPDQSNSGMGYTSLQELTLSVTVETGDIRQYSPSTDLTPDTAPNSIGLTDATTVRQPLPAGRIAPRRPETGSEELTTVSFGWAGVHQQTVSVLGVCSIAGADALLGTLTVEATGSQGTL